MKAGSVRWEREGETVMEIRIPDEAVWIIEQLNEHGYEAYVVGGCVRDSLLGRVPKDWDITTSAMPAEVKAIFKRTIDTGIQHGTVTVMVDHVGYEVTTYRIDGEYEDGRHPVSVDFTASLFEDLKRRDFTINAMACDSRGNLVDQFGGLKDLENGIIRCVGSAVSRFTEDALRILRAVRFSAQLGFAIEEETEQAIGLIAPNLRKVSRERIAVELTKLLLSDNPDRIRLVHDTGVSHFISPRFEKAADLTKEQLELMKRLPASKYMRWAGFLRYESAGTAVDILQELKMDCDTMDRVKLLVSMWRKGILPRKAEVRRAMSGVSPDMFDSLLCFQEVFAGEILARETPDRTVPNQELPGQETPYHGILSTVKALTAEIRAAGDPLTLKDLAVSGRDLTVAGLKPGPELGRTLKQMLEDVLEYPEHNTKEYLLSAYF